ncbi:MAG TPA: phycobiliprotein lyase [Cyanobacteria bacterium UBA12227]|nr:phycobiliprotein lyase [Cyanobacteria bacterium UBA12227]HAX86722.1 phycobiliprotein lyase [Cyanobacteria bacterium UBA11370]HBY78205.1 phycobiliprotein lyase [Cyanobacteria bacterium UBA11148]
MDAMEFFELSAGKWRSQRTTHHLPFRRSEAGESEIEVATLKSDHPQVVEICQLHQVDPSLAAGGAWISWHGTMAWDRSEEENHTGSSVMVIVPDPGNPRQGMLLRERGYAEIVPVAGRYLIDDQDALILLTDYETMSSEERFSFVSPDLRMRTSTVKRFGGFSTTSLCVEARIGSSLDDGNVETKPQPVQDSLGTRTFESLLGW